MTNKAPVKPPSLLQGDTIGIMAPSTLVNPDAMDQAAHKIKDAGYAVYFHQQVYLQHGSSAGTPQDKADALHDLIRDNNIKAVLAAGGGNHSGTFLNLIDYKLIEDHPKIICGYSDVTGILCAVTKHAGIETYHGPTASHLTRDKYTDEQFSQWLGILSGKNDDILLGGADTVKSGTGEGRLIGGNLSLISSLMGTPYQPDFEDGILFLEDCDDQLSRYARMITQLSNAGVFDKIKGVILGDFSEAPDTASTPFGMTIREIIAELTDRHDYPVIVNAPFGHGNDLPTYPVGRRVTLKAGDDIAKLSI